MKCPFLEEIMVRYCKACTVKKMLPTDSLVDSNLCDGTYESCAAYRDFLSLNNKI